MPVIWPSTNLEMTLLKKLLLFLSRKEDKYLLFSLKTSKIVSFRNCNTLTLWKRCVTGAKGFQGPGARPARLES